MNHLTLTMLICLSASISCIQAILYGEPPQCYERRLASSISKSPIKIISECDSEGFYKPLQCLVHKTSEKTVILECRCVNKLGRDFTSSSRNLRSCACPYIKGVTIYNSNVIVPDPACDVDGTFKRKQCSQSKDKCFCVNKETGKTEIPSIDLNSECEP